MKLSDGEREMLEKVHLLSGQTIETVKEVLEGIVTQMVFDFLEERPTSFPLIGDMKLDYLGDSIEDGARKARVHMTFDPNNFLAKVIGQLVDGEENEIEKLYKRKIRISLEGLASE